MLNSEIQPEILNPVVFPADTILNHQLSKHTIKKREKGEINFPSVLGIPDKAEGEKIGR